MTVLSAVVLVSDGKTAVSPVNSTPVWSIARRHTSKVHGIQHWTCGTSGIRWVGCDRGSGYTDRAHLWYPLADRFNDRCGLRHGNRDAMTSRIFGGQYGIGGNTRQLVGLVTKNTVKIIKALSLTRTGGQAMLLRGVVEATRALSRVLPWTHALARLRATFPVTQ
jgi:hypothetical protein